MSFESISLGCKVWDLHTRLSVSPFEGQPFRIYSVRINSIFPHEEAEGDLAVLGPTVFFHEFCQDFKAIPQRLKQQGHKAAGPQ